MITSLRLNAEKALAKTGREQSKLIFARIEELVKILRFKYDIYEIKMGMGRWCFGTRNGRVYEDDREIDSNGDLENWLDSPIEERAKYLFSPSPTITEREEKYLDEIQELLDFLTNEPWLEIKDFKFD